MTIIPAWIGNLRGTEILIIAVVALLLFGANRIPELMRGLGKGVHAFKQGLAEAKEEINKPVNLEKAEADSNIETPAK